MAAYIATSQQDHQTSEMRGSLLQEHPQQLQETVLNSLVMDIRRELEVQTKTLADLNNKLAPIICVVDEPRGEMKESEVSRAYSSVHASQLDELVGFVRNNTRAIRELMDRLEI